MRITEGRLIVSGVVLMTLIALVRYASAPGPSPCPPQFKRFTTPTFSLCYPWSWRNESLLKKSERPPWQAPWVEFIVMGGGDAFLSVDVIPVNPTDFPPTMENREQAIDLYAYQKGFASRLRLRKAWKLRASGESIVEGSNGTSMRHRVLYGSTDGPETYDFGKLYQTQVIDGRMPQPRDKQWTHDIAQICMNGQV